MNPYTVALGAGLQRGRIEFRHIVTSGQELWSAAFFPAVALIVMYLLDNTTVPGTDFSLGTHAIPGILAMTVAFTGLLQLAMALTMDREDGTLLRAKAIPNGMPGYVTGKVTSRAAMTVASVLIVLIPAAFLFDGLQLRSASPWLTLAWVLALGLIAVLPLGAIVGALFTNVQSLSFVSLLVMGLVAISGIFYPITVFPTWLQWIGQASPLYWLGLGMRSALLPDAMSAAEIGQSWRHLETIGALGTWAGIGLVVAPIVLRRMARRESGSRVAARREKAMQRPA